jgi:type IX secretion system PorP/SprF family membrane protein
MFGCEDAAFFDTFQIFSFEPLRVGKVGPHCSIKGKSALSEPLLLHFYHNNPPIRRFNDHFYQLVFMKKHFFCLLFCGCAVAVSAQQDAMFTKYMFNSMSITPAYAGSHEALRMSAQIRRQWWGFAGAPITGLVSVDGVSKDTRAGWGALIGYEKIGLYQTQDLYGNYAYRFEMGEGKMAIGIRGGGTLYQNQLTQADLADASDWVYANNTNFFVPKFGLGAYYQDENWYCGLSIPTLVSLRQGRRFTVRDDSSFLRRHYFAHTGFVREIDRGLFIKPSILLKYVKGAPPQADLNLQVYFNNLIGVGASFRTSDAVVMMVEVFPVQQLRIGYSYDFTTSRLRYYGGGAHELIVSYELGSNKRRGMSSKYKMRDIKYF